MKKYTLFLIAFVLAVLLTFVLVVKNINVNAQNNAALNTIIHHYAARNYLSEPVSQAELELIIQAGVNAPSARNRQPWHFTVVQNTELAKRIINGVNDGNVLIVVSAPGDNKTNTVEILDCALATQSIYLAAQALGLGSRIYTAPISEINKNLKTPLSLPQGYSAVSVVRIGKIKQTDTVSAASSRKKAQEVVTYKR